MNTNHLKIFLDVAQTKSYTKTAQNTYVSQPAVSQAIKSLERELNVSLFERDRNHVILTKIGEYFYHELLPIMNQLDVTLDHLKLVSERYEASVSVGYSGTMLEARKVSDLQQFLKNHPNATIHMENLEMKNLGKYLLDGQCDLIFHFSTQEFMEESISFYPLHTGKFAAMLSKDNPLSVKDKLQFDDLINQSFVFINSQQCFPQQQTLQELIKTRCNPPMFYYADSYTLTHELIKKGLGITILPDFLEDETDMIRIIPFNYDAQLTYGISVLKENDNPLVHNIIKEIALKPQNTK